MPNGTIYLFLLSIYLLLLFSKVISHSLLQLIMVFMIQIRNI